MDVPAYVGLKGFLPIIMVLFYQMTLLIAYLIGGMPGRLMTKGIIKWMKYSPAHYDTITASRNYPYYYNTKNVVTSIFNKQNLFLYKYKPSVPVVYIYGKKKPFQFHGERWIKYLNEHDKCEMHGMPTGHWIMNQEAKFITDLILRRLR